MFTKSTSLYLLMGMFAFQTIDSRGEPEVKYTPGHYIAADRPDRVLGEMEGIRDAVVKGVIKRYSWVGMEPAKGKYDFDPIRRDLEYLASIDKQLIVFIVDKTFSGKDANPIPAYMRSHAIKNAKGGMTGKKWDPVLIERQVALCQALSKAFDANPNFEGIAYQESAPSVPRDQLLTIGYTPELMRDGLTKLLIESAKAFPRSRVFWYMNFLPMNNDYLEDIAEAVAPYHVVMGGPDILPYRDALQRIASLHEKFKGKMKLFCSAQTDSYRHHKDDRSNGTKEPYHRGAKPIHPDGYVTMEEIFTYGRDKLHLNYIFWSYKTYPGKRYPGDPEQWTFRDALEVIRKHPTFNQ
ncbi:MAG: hypothetical protein K9M45_03305 [Kiritimatiellales bacterium]|nr:hypothetical protein [Kiritimatiellales bacterium]